MKKLSYALLLFMSIWSIQACNNNPNKENSVDSAKTVNKETKVVDKSTSDFVVNAASGGMMEVELGQYAQQNARSQRVKDFGSMMVTDHTKANDELKALANEQNIAIPATVSDKQQKNIDDLKKKKGAEFDKDYMKMMVDDHKSDIDDFQKAGKDLTDSTIRDFAVRTLPVLQKHLDSAQAITGKK